MIRAFREFDIDEIMEIWLDVNIQAHDFISGEYWKENYDMVKSLLPRAEIYVYEHEEGGSIKGFMGLNEGYIEGIFVRDEYRSKGIGKKLLDHVKGKNKSLSLCVYEKNERALDFYRREGFFIEEEGIDDSTGERELVLTWKLY